MPTSLCAEGAKCCTKLPDGDLSFFVLHTHRFIDIFDCTIVKQLGLRTMWPDASAGDSIEFEHNVMFHMEQK